MVEDGGDELLKPDQRWEDVQSSIRAMKVWRCEDIQPVRCSNLSDISNSLVGIRKADKKSCRPINGPSLELAAEGRALEPPLWAPGELHGSTNKGLMGGCAH